MNEFCMPSLGADMETGTLVEWKIKPGDWVKRGDIIADVETDKGIIEIEVFEDGIVDQILVEPMTEVPVGMAMALLRTESEEAAEKRRLRTLSLKSPIPWIIEPSAVLPAEMDPDAPEYRL